MVVVNRQEGVAGMIEVGAVVVSEAAQKDPAEAVLQKADAAAHTDKAWVVEQGDGTLELQVEEHEDELAAVVRKEYLQPDLETAAMWTTADLKL